MPNLKLEQFYGSGLYTVIIDNKARGETVYGYLTSPIQLATTTEWTDIVENRYSGGIADKLTQATLNRSMTVQEFTNQSWRGSQIPHISIQIGRVAIRTSTGEIIDPTKKLLAWNMPPELDGFTLRPPTATQDGGSGMISLQVGRWIFARDLLPVSTSIDYSKEVDQKEGRPIRYDATIELQASKILTAKDIKGWFV